MIHASDFDKKKRYTINMKNGHYYHIESIVGINAERNSLSFIDIKGNQVLIDCVDISTQRIIPETK